MGLRVYLRMDGDLGARFLQIKQHLGLKNDTEVLRTLINWFWREHLPELQSPPLEHFNVSEHGVRILDRTLTDNSPKGRIIDVYLKPDKVWCEYCNATDCRHVKFALEIPEVREVIRSKGWKIPLE
jgi:hypothetical protein